MTYFEPVKGSGAERRDELGNTAPYRTQPHRGSDWGFSNGSHRKPALAIHDGIVTYVGNETALGWTVIAKNINGDVDLFIEYNHFDEKPKVVKGDRIKGGETIVGLIGATGTSISNKNANHLHASAAPAKIPHKAERALLKDLFKLIDASKPVEKKPVAKKPPVKKAAK